MVRLMDKNKKIRLQITVVAAGCAVNFILFFVKLYTGLSTNSISIYADAINNGLDSLDCVAALAGISVLAVKVSERYPFGLGRAQNITDFIISLSVAFTGLYFGYVSLERLMYPVPVWYSVRYAVLIAATAAVKLALGIFYYVFSKRVPTYTIKALVTDSILDFFITLSTLVSFTLSEKVGYSVDGAAGIIIAVVLTVHGVKMVVETFTALLGRNDESRCREAEEILAEEAINVQSIACHLYGDKAVFTAVPSEDITHTQQSAATNKIKSRLGADIFFGSRS